MKDFFWMFQVKWSIPRISSPGCFGPFVSVLFIVFCYAGPLTRIFAMKIADTRRADWIVENVSTYNSVGLYA